jgi:hypothetical protein
MRTFSNWGKRVIANANVALDIALEKYLSHLFNSYQLPCLHSIALYFIPVFATIQRKLDSLQDCFSAWMRLSLSTAVFRKGRSHVLKMKIPSKLTISHLIIRLLDYWKCLNRILTDYWEVRLSRIAILPC